MFIKSATAEFRLRSVKEALGPRLRFDQTETFVGPQYKGRGAENARQGATRSQNVHSLAPILHRTPRARV